MQISFSSFRRSLPATLVVCSVAMAGCSGAVSEPAADTRTAGQPASTSAAPSPSTSASSAASASPSATAPTTTRRPTGDPRAADIVTGLTSPWGLAFLKDGSALITERDTKLIKHLTGDKLADVAELDDVEPQGEGGLLGIAVTPDQKTVFAYYTSNSDNRVVSMSWDGKALGEPRTIIDGMPESGRHNGGQLAVGGDGYLYVATGDAGESERSQDKKSLAGKILKVTFEGKPAPDNPFDNEIFSMGHRNVQGLAFDDRGRLWATEFGEQTWDELNMITKGGNYGWPAVEGSAKMDGMINPKVVWKTSEASPSGLAYWNGSLWMAALRGQRLWEIPVDGTTAGDPKSYFNQRYGRLRAVKVAPDGDSLWLGTSNTDGRLEPKAGDDRLLRVTR